LGNLGAAYASGAPILAFKFLNGACQLVHPKLPKGARVLEKGDGRLAYLNTYLTGRKFLLDRFSVADAYLFTVLNCNIATPVDLERWPAYTVITRA